jgi:type II secretory pathway pseudopilin PulG
MSTADKTSQSGSVLIEALAALAIMSTAVVMGLGGFAETIARLRQADDRLLALTLARNLVTETIGLASSMPSGSEGTSEEGFRWSIEIREKPSRHQAFLLKPYKILVKVSQADGSPLIVLETTALALDRK